MNDRAQLADLLDPEAVASLLLDQGVRVESAEPNYVRCKPGESTIVGYVLKLRNDTRPPRPSDVADSTELTTIAYARWCADPDRAATIQRKARSLRPRPSAAGPGLVDLAGATMFLAPNDARLRQLRWFLEPRKLKRSLAAEGPPLSSRRTTVEVLRYKPERRIVSRARLVTSSGCAQNVIIRYSTRRQAARHAELVAALRGNHVATPRQLGRYAHDRVSIDAYIDGQTVLEATRRGVELDVAAFVDGLCRFHDTEPVASVDRRSHTGEIARALGGLYWLGQWYRGLDRVIRAVERELRIDPGPGSDTVLLHGDLHQKNVLHADGRFHFIDLDRSAVGPPEIDLGYLVAHAIAMQIRRPGFAPRALDLAHDALAGYRRQRSGPDRALAAHVAVGLVDQALLVARRLEADGEQRCAALLEAATSQLTTSR